MRPALRVNLSAARLADRNFWSPPNVQTAGVVGNQIAHLERFVPPESGQHD